MYRLYRWLSLIIPYYSQREDFPASHVNVENGQRKNHASCLRRSPSPTTRALVLRFGREWTHWSRWSICSIFGAFRSYREYQSWSSHGWPWLSIETHGDLGIPYFKKPPFEHPCLRMLFLLNWSHDHPNHRRFWMRKALWFRDNKNDKGWTGTRNLFPLRVHLALYDTLLGEMTQTWHRRNKLRHLCWYESARCWCIAILHSRASFPSISCSINHPN